MTVRDPAILPVHALESLNNSDTRIRRSRQLIADSRALMNRTRDRGLWHMTPPLASPDPSTDVPYWNVIYRATAAIAASHQVQKIATALLTMSRERLASSRANALGVAVMTEPDLVAQG